MKDMSKNTLTAIIAGVCGLVVICGIFAVMSTYRYQKDAEINAQTQVERTKIESERSILTADIAAKQAVEKAEIDKDAAVQQTKERMNAIPWYKGGENKKGQ